MVNTTFNIIYNADNCDNINVGARPAVKNVTQSENSNEAPALDVRPKDNDVVNSQTQEIINAECQIAQNQKTECTNETLIPKKLNLSKYQLGMHQGKIDDPKN